MNSGINPKEKDYELARENTVAMNCHFLVCGIISIAYFVEFLKGDGTLLYVLATIILAMGPVVGEIICYKKQHDTKMIKHFVGIGYAILYTFVMFTTNNHFTFVYVIPMLIAITVYNDFKYSLPIEVGVVIVNVIQLALFFKRGIYGICGNPVLCYCTDLWYSAVCLNCGRKVESEEACRVEGRT